MTLVWCWLITRKDGTKLGFTTFDLPITIGGVTYYGGTGFSPSARQQSDDLERADNQQLMGVFDSTQITEKDLRIGLYDYAAIRCFLVDPSNPPTTLEDDPPKHIEFPDSYLGQVKRSDRTFEFEAKDSLSLLDTQIGSETSKFCRATLGDERCGVNLSQYTHTNTVTGVYNRRIFEIDSDKANKYFDRGKITFTTGFNEGVTRDIAFYETHRITLIEPLPYGIAIGDEVTLVAGCNKTKFNCLIYNNIINFQGEPDIPTEDKAVYMPKF
jgi:uncharacterized phage protein (TIGR02218 family)